ncbi:MAG: TraI domain-containing protein [Pseudomonadota bacterium]
MKTLSEKSLQPLLDETTNFARFMGRYYLHELHEGVSACGQDYWLLTLADASGELKVYCHNPELMEQKPAVGMWIHVEASLSQPKGVAYFRCKNLQIERPVECIGADLSSLPRAACPIDYAFDALFFIVSRISNQVLRDFVRGVLLQPDVAVSYLRCPASVNHHHNYEGGLLVHSLEMAWQIICAEELLADEQDIAVVAALLHDIGKVWTLKPQLRRTPMGSLVGHDYLTLEVCAKPLKKLSEAAPGFANQLRHAWTCHSPKARYGFKPRTRVAKYLQRVDHDSAFVGYPEAFLPRFSQASQTLVGNL